MRETEGESKIKRREEVYITAKGIGGGGWGVFFLGGGIEEMVERRYGDRKA